MKSQFVLGQISTFSPCVAGNSYARAHARAVSAMDNMEVELQVKWAIEASRKIDRFSIIFLVQLCFRAQSFLS
jgi:hypothetical protein